MTQIFIVSGTSWTVPGDWSNSNSIETIGGGGGTANSVGSGTGGGGGGYSKITNLSGLSGSITLSIGSGGSSGAAGGDTWFNGASIGASSSAPRAGAAAVSDPVALDRGVHLRTASGRPNIPAAMAAITAQGAGRVPAAAVRPGPMAPGESGQAALEAATVLAAAAAALAAAEPLAWLAARMLAEMVEIILAAAGAALGRQPPVRSVRLARMAAVAAAVMAPDLAQPWAAAAAAVGTV